jgi:hypothetical protein
MNRKSSSRRVFLKHAMIVAGSSVLVPRVWSWTGSRPGETQDTDASICRQKFASFIEQGLQGKPIGEAIVSVGKSFIGTPYHAHTLEIPGEERLVVNLRGLDCVTFTENALVLSRCIKLNKITFDDYKAQLQLIRYRDGIINGYPSRLHYFSDWIDNNAKKGIIRDMTREAGGESYDKKIHFMTSHRSSYQQLTDNESFRGVQAMERSLGKRRHYYIPRNRLTPAQPGVENGDIIGITTTQEGMDIAHTGLAIRADGVLKFLHAPLSTGSVAITEHSLAEYVHVHTKQSGIMVARPREPKR